MLTGRERAAESRRLAIEAGKQSLYAMGISPECMSLLEDDAPPDEGSELIAETLNAPAKPGSPAPKPITIEPDELLRLRRLVQLVTTTVGELNLWLASAGKPLDTADR